MQNNYIEPPFLEYIKAIFYGIVLIEWVDYKKDNGQLTTFPKINSPLRNALKCLDYW
tara:strand:+ start:347 stop:517 length:171 start_codon:yes stop_codon:yes gene_type:complete